MITGRLMEDDRLIGGHLMEVQLYTEWDDNMMGTIAEKVPCVLKDQHVLIKQRHTLTKV